MAGNRKFALPRLHGLVRRLYSNGKEMRAYDEAITQYQKDVLAKKKKVARGPPFPQHVYYMPHREVIREASRTTRLRVVFDAYSHDSEVSSLNSHLKRAPNLGADLLKMLINF